MKRFFILSLSLLLSLSAFAQIRIEKRHYNKGWYISRSHSVKAHTDTTARKAKAIAHVPAKTNTDASALTNENTEKKIVYADSSAQIVKPVPAKTKTASAKTIIRAAQTSSVSSEKPNAIPFHAKESFGRETKTVQTQSADPGDSFWVYLFESMRPFFITIGIIILVFLAAIIIYGLITSPLATILGLVLIIFCPDILLWM